MKKIFITGGAGYVGSVLTAHLLSKWYIVTVLDLMIYGKNVLPIHKNLNINPIYKTIRDYKLVTNTTFNDTLTIMNTIMIQIYKSLYESTRIYKNLQEPIRINKNL